MEEGTPVIEPQPGPTEKDVENAAAAAAAANTANTATDASTGAGEGAADCGGADGTVGDAAEGAADDESGKEEGSGKNKKRKVAIFLAYVGKGYQGMQRNPGAVTIEDELERAIVAAGGISADNAGDFTKVNWMRAARTDKGVSAVGQCISLRMMLDPPGIIERINEKLPTGFEFFGYTRVTGGFNAKTMCDRRKYEYVIPVKAFNPTECKPRREIEAEAALAAQAAEATGGGIDDDGLCGAAADSTAKPFVFDDAVRARVNKVLSNYCGTHNFHNYTVRVDPNEPSAMRYIISFDCSEPFVVDGVEFVRCIVVGQSFMLHQIRKLIGMMLGVVRGAWSEDDQIFALKTKQSCNVPMAPELGLFLCECIYHAYNARYAATHEPMLLENYADKVEAFKTTFIYPHMAKTETEEETMQTWIRMLPVKQIQNSIAHARHRDGGRAFLGKGNNSNKRKGGPDGGDRSAGNNNNGNDGNDGNKKNKNKAATGAGGGGAPAEANGSPAATEDATTAAAAAAAATEVDTVPVPSANATAHTPPTSEAATAPTTVKEGEMRNVPPPPPPPPTQQQGGHGGVGSGRGRGRGGGRGDIGGGRGGRGRGYDRPGGAPGGGRRQGRGRGRGGPKNAVRNAYLKSNEDFDPAELSD